MWMVMLMLMWMVMLMVGCRRLDVGGWRFDVDV